MTLNEYQQEAKTLREFPDLIVRPSLAKWDPLTDEGAGSVAEEVMRAPSLSYIYPALGIAGETGEVIEKVKKILRDDKCILTPERREAIKMELGDVLWYLSALALELGLTLEEVALSNIDKFKDRNERGVVHGSGDDR